jgi:hypothetical protein
VTDGAMGAKEYGFEGKIAVVDVCSELREERRLLGQRCFYAGPNNYFLLLRVSELSERNRWRGRVDDGRGLVTQPSRR